MVRDQQAGPSRERADKFLSEFSFVEDTLDNDNYQMLLEQEAIVNIAKIEYGWYGESGNVIFKAIGYEQLKTQLDHYKDILKEKQSLTLIINLNSYHWVTLVIAYFQQQLTAYYVDSLGQKLPDNISDTLKDEIENTKDFKIKQQQHWYDCGIFALENARVINEAIQKSKDPIAAVPDFRLTDDLLKTMRKEYTKSLSRRDKIENKFEVLIKFLERLNRQRLRMKEFNFQNVNILLFFLETLALQDPVLQDSGCPDTKSKLWPYEQKLVDQGIIDLNDLKCVQYIRSDKIFHRDACSKIKPADFKEIVNFKEVGDVKELFQELKKYAEQTYLKLKGEIVNQSDCKKLTDLFDNRNENVQLGNIITQKQLRKYILIFFKNSTAKVCYENNRLNLEKANENIFNFVVNIIPFIDMRYKKPAKPVGTIKEFRGDLLHTFYKLGDNYKLIGIALKDFMCKYAPYFFKYYYSLEVHSALCKVGCHDAVEIDKHLKGLLKKFQNKFERIYFAAKEDKNKGDVNKEDSFEFANSALVHSEINKADLENYAHEYIKLMSIIENEEAIQWREKKHQESDVPSRYKELRTDDKRQIYEDFKYLKSLYNMKREGILDREDVYEKEKKLLLKKLKGPYGILKEDFNAMVKSFVENVDNSCIDGEHDIVEALLALMIIKKNHSNISNQEIIKKFTERNSFQNSKRTLEQKFKSIPKGKIIKILIPSGKTDKTKAVSLNTDRFTENIFQVFNNTYFQYRLVFNNIEEAFNDELFLDCLTHENGCISKNLVEKILKINYMTPYVARLLSKDELINKNIITDKEFLETLENLLKKDSYMKHLKKLLKEGISGEKLKSILKPHDKNFNKINMKPILYENICNKIVRNDINIENMHLIFEEPEHTEGILKAFCKKIGTADQKAVVILIKKVLKILNNIANELYNTNNKDNLDLALILLDSKKGAQNARKILITKKLVETNDLDILQAKRSIARIKIRLGKFKRNANEAKDLYNNAYGILDSMKKNIEKSLENNILFPHFFLTLSDLAYTYHLLCDCNQAYYTYKTLYHEMIKIILNLSNDDLLGFHLSTEHYNSIVQSETYKRILELSPKYLNILKIRSDMANELKCLTKAEQKLLPKKGSQDYEMKFNEVIHYYLSALNIYEEVYGIKTSATIAQNNLKTMRDIAYIYKRLGNFKLSKTHDYEKSNYVLSDKKKPLEEIKNLEGALSDYKNALNMYENVKQIQAQEKWETHPAVLEAGQIILKIMRDIAYINNKLGSLKQPRCREEAMQHYNEAFKIYEKLLFIQKSILYEEHEYVLSTLNDIAYTRNMLAYLKSQDKPEETLKHYEESIKIYEKVYKIRMKTLGEENNKTRKARENLKKTRSWFNKANRSQQARKRIRLS